MSTKCLVKTYSISLSESEKASLREGTIKIEIMNSGCPASSRRIEKATNEPLGMRIIEAKEEFESVGCMESRVGGARPCLGQASTARSKQSES